MKKIIANVISFIVVLTILTFICIDIKLTIGLICLLPFIYLGVVFAIGAVGVAYGLCEIAFKDIRKIVLNSLGN